MLTLFNMNSSCLYLTKYWRTVNFVELIDYSGECYGRSVCRWCFYLYLFSIWAKRVFQCWSRYHSWKGMLWWLIKKYQKYHMTEKLFSWYVWIIGLGLKSYNIHVHTWDQQKKWIWATWSSLKICFFLICNSRKWSSNTFICMYTS